MSTSAFQRARKPDEKAHRQKAILEAAASLFETKGLDAVSLNAVADRAGVVKSNVYRYFESREAIFMSLLLEDLVSWVTAVEETFSQLPPRSDIKTVARALAGTMVAARRLCTLMAALSSVLEQNVSEEGVIGFKRAVLRVAVRFGNVMRSALPSMPASAVGPLLRFTHAIVAGLYPIAHPAPAVARAISQPDLVVFRSDFQKDLERMLGAVLTSLCEQGAAP
jgi:AcrR family transcriptional regulator